MKKSVAMVMIIMVVAACYAPAGRNGFVWDDTALVLRDPLIRSWRLIPEGFNHFLFTDATASDFYRPIQRLTYTIEYAFFAFNPAPYHATSILCHVVAALALFILSEEFLLLFGLEPPKRVILALLTTVIWAVHPVQSAAVVYVSGRADPLAAAFGFLGFYLVLRSGRAGSGKALFFLGGATTALLLSALSKEIGLIFPILAIAVFALNRKWTAMLKAVGIALFVATIYLSLRLAAEHVPPPTMGSPAPALVRPIIVARAIAEYAGLIAVPLNLHMDRDVETQPVGFNDATLNAAAWREQQTLVGILLAAALVYWMNRARRRNPAVFACLFVAAMTYLPVSGIVPLNATVAEHWMYLPTAFLFLAAAIQFSTLLQNRKSAIQFAASGALVVWLAFLGARTFARTFDWKDQRTFVERTIAGGGDSARMLINLALVDLNDGKFVETRTHLQEALQKKPDHPLALINLAALALKQNDLKRARELLTKAAEIPAVAAKAHEFLAVLEHKENGAVNLLRLRLAAHTGPPNWSIERRYIEVLNEAGAVEQAITELQNCLRTEWYRAESWHLLAQLLSNSGRTQEAIPARARAAAYDVHLSAQTSTL